MFTIEDAQAALAAVGTESAPTVEVLEQARDAFVSAARTAKDAGDKQALASMLEAIKVTRSAIDEAQAKLAAEREELEALTADIPELRDEAPAADAAAAVVDDPAPAMLSVSEAVARLGLATPGKKREEVAVVTEPRQKLVLAGQERSDASWADLGNAFSKQTSSMMRDGRTVLMSVQTDFANRLTGRTGENTRLLDDLARRAGEEAVVAAGGCCTIAEPIRDIPMLASTARPIADALPTVGASAGAVTFYPPVCLPQGGIATWTCVQDAAVDPANPATWKQCEHIECAEPLTETVEAIYKCLTIGNFQQKFSPERWDAILAATSAAQARLAEQTLFNKIANSANVTDHTVTDTGSVYATTLRSLLLAWATIRQNQRYEGRRARTILPSWVEDAAAMDMITRAAERGRQAEQDSLETRLAAAGIDVIWSPDINPIEPAGQVNGPLTNFPATFDAVLFVDGGVFRLDGGELNMGTDIRDHDLNRQNNVAAFAETFETAVVRSCDSKHLTIPVSICGVNSCPTVPAP